MQPTWLELIKAALKYAAGLEFVAGHRTHLAAAGLLLLGLSQVLQGDFDNGLQSVLLALTAFGLRQAIPAADAPK